MNGWWGRARSTQKKKKEEIRQILGKKKPESGCVDFFL